MQPFPLGSWGAAGRGPLLTPSVTGRLLSRPRVHPKDTEPRSQTAESPALLGRPAGPTPSSTGAGGPSQGPACLPFSRETRKREERKGKGRQGIRRCSLACSRRHRPGHCPLPGAGPFPAGAGQGPGEAASGHHPWGPAAWFRHRGEAGHPRSPSRPWLPPTL